MKTDQLEINWQNFIPVCLQLKVCFYNVTLNNLAIDYQKLFLLLHS